MKPGKKKLNRGPYSQVVLEDDLKAIVMQIRSRFADTFSGRFRTIVMRTHNEAVAELEKRLGLVDELTNRRLPEESYIDVVKKIVENRKYFEKEYTKHSWLSYEQALKAGTLEYQLQNMYVRRSGLSPLSAGIKHIPYYIDKNGGMTYYDPYFFDPEKPDDTQS